jgi:perosamine synthetase
MKKEDLKQIKSELDNFFKLFKNRPVSLHEPDISNLEKKIVQKSLSENEISTSGKYTKIFENELKKITKSKYVIPIINGSYSLYLSMLCAPIKKNEEVLVQNLNYVATANAILSVGAIPHIIDNTYTDLGIDCLKLEKYLFENTIIKEGKCINKKTLRVIKAIVPMHTFGVPSDITGILKIAKKFKLIVIEDAAEGLGSTINNRHLGTFGKVGILSFNGNKIVTSGTGGAILTGDKKLANLIRHKSQICKINHPWKYNYDGHGYNLKLPSINAALGYSQLKRLKTFLIKKNKIFKIYKNFFSGSKYFDILYRRKNTETNNWLITLILKKDIKKLKTKLILSFIKKKIHVRPAWQLLSEIKYLKKMPKMNLMQSKELFSRIINLPSGTKVLNKIKKNV